METSSRFAQLPAWRTISTMVLFIVAAASSACTSGSRPAQPAPGPALAADRAAVAAVLDDFHDAAAKADFSRYFSHWTDDSVFLGTDATERWAGSEFRDFARPFFDQGRGWTYRPHHRSISLAPSRRFAWFDELLDNDTLGLCRGSGVLEQRSGRWVILQYNLSIPIPNDLAASITGQIMARQTGGTP